MGSILYFSSINDVFSRGRQGPSERILPTEVFADPLRSRRTRLENTGFKERKYDILLIYVSAGRVEN